MRRLRILTSRFPLRALVLTIAIAVLCLFVIKPARVPATVAIHGELSKSEAESLHWSTSKMLHWGYWREMKLRLVANHFKDLWDVQHFPTRIHALSKEPDGWFSVSATSRLGDSYTFRCPQPVVPLPTRAWKYELVAGGFVWSAPAQLYGATNGSRPAGPETNQASGAAGSVR
jgi:hypothetical protein